MEGTIESALAQFEPDPDATFGFRSAQPGSRDADGLEWIAWSDADGELSWAADELRHMAPRSLP
jgi:hypothetical protein